MTQGLSGEILPEPTRRGRREGGRRPGAAERKIDQLAYGQPRMRLKPVEIVSADELESIHEASLQVLEEIGMEFLHADAREMLRKAGARVDGERVRFGRDIIEAALASAPSEFLFHARNPAHTIRLGGDWMAFGNVSSPPNCSDMEGGRRVGNLQDYRNFLRLSQYFIAIVPPRRQARRTHPIRTILLSGGARCFRPDRITNPHLAPAGRRQ